MKVFRDEAQVLSSCKRDLETRLQNLKHQLMLFDSVRKQLSSVIANLSKSLQLSAQNFKVSSGYMHCIRRSSTVSNISHCSFTMVQYLPAK